MTNLPVHPSQDQPVEFSPVVFYDEVPMEMDFRPKEIDAAREVAVPKEGSAMTPATAPAVEASQRSSEETIVPPMPNPSAPQAPVAPADEDEKPTIEGFSGLI